MSLRRAAALAAFSLLALAPSASALAVSDLALVKVGSFATPMDVAAPSGENGRLYVVQRAGTVRLLRSTGKTLTFLDISASVSTTGEGGLLSIAFPPNYSTTRRFFAYYTTPTEVRLSSFAHDSGNPDHASASSESVLMSWPKPANDQHYGHTVAVGPDGKVYVATGDGGPEDPPPGTAQDSASPLGKLLRLNAHGTVPAGNPSGTAVYALGLRNPYGMTFDRQTGDSVIADVGWNTEDEIDFSAGGAPAGANFGWPCYEGDVFIDAGQNCAAVTNYPPAMTISHTGLSCLSTIGGVVVRDQGVPSLSGRYLYGDYCSGDLRSVALSSGGASGDAPTGLNVPSLVAFGEDGCGRVYAVSFNGRVYRVQEGHKATPC